jgi:beta-phosphoglucomutase
LTVGDAWGVLFDLDGVLIDSPDVHARAWAEVFRPYGIELPPLRLHREEGRTSLEIGRRIVRDYQLDLNDGELEKLIERKRSIYRRNSPDGMRLDARTAIRELKTLGWKVGLVTGSVRKNLESALPPDEINLFDLVVTAESYIHGKPNPEPYLKACEIGELDHERSVAIENAPLGIASARAAGLRVVALTSTLPEAELSGADAVIDDLTVLPRLLGSWKVES